MMRCWYLLLIGVAAAAQNRAGGPGASGDRRHPVAAQAVVSPDGARLAWVESGIFTAPAASGGATVEIAPGGSCEKNNLAWSPDSKQIAFLSDREKAGQLQLYVAPGYGRRRARN